MISWAAAGANHEIDLDESAPIAVPLDEAVDMVAFSCLCVKRKLGTDVATGRRDFAELASNSSRVTDCSNKLMLLEVAVANSGGRVVADTPRMVALFATQGRQ